MFGISTDKAEICKEQTFQRCVEQRTIYGGIVAIFHAVKTGPAR